MAILTIHNYPDVYINNTILEHVVCVRQKGSSFLIRYLIQEEEAISNKDIYNFSLRSPKSGTVIYKSHNRIGYTVSKNIHIDSASYCDIFINGYKYEEWDIALDSNIKIDRNAARLIAEELKEL